MGKRRKIIRLKCVVVLEVECGDRVGIRDECLVYKLIAGWLMGCGWTVADPEIHCRGPLVSTIGIKGIRRNEVQ